MDGDAVQWLCAGVMCDGTRGVNGQARWATLALALGQVSAHAFTCGSRLRLTCPRARQCWLRCNY
jgi:hypothetical protein